MRCASYCITKQFNINELQEYYSKKYKCKIHENALHISLGEDEDLFIIYGALIFWNVTKRKESYFIMSVKKFASQHVENLNEEEIEFDFGEKEGVKQDYILINKNTESLSKIAASFGLAQSAMLSYFEDKVDKTIAKCESLISTLAEKGSIPLSHVEISKRVGQLFLVRNQINMQSDILDIPVFIWNNSEHEELYKQATQNMKLVPRTVVLNKRLDIIQELFDVLKNQVIASHSMRLEWVIIWLIFIEIVITLFIHYK